MSLAEIKERALNLEEGEQRELIAFLVAHRATQQGDFRAELARKIDDREPSHWIELDALKTRVA